MRHVTDAVNICLIHCQPNVIIRLTIGALSINIALMVKVTAIIILILSLSAAPAFSADDEYPSPGPRQQLGRLVVTQSRIPIGPDEGTRSVTSLDSKLLDTYSYEAVTDTIAAIGGIDMRRRGAEGVQADINIRGAGFEQNAVLVDGVRLYDPQTGHFLMDLPITSGDVESIEILKGASSSLYGPNAFGGVINIKTKKPKGVHVKASAEGGSFDYFKTALSVTNPFGPINNRFSIEESRSSGYRPETNFNILSLSNSSSVKTFLGVYNALFGFLKKDFGANQFYSNLYPNEEEHTDTRFFKIDGQAEDGDLTVRPNLFLRRHWDKFALDTNRPGWQTNYSTTYDYGGGADFVMKNDAADVSYGFLVTRDTINSTNMGIHERFSEAFYGEVAPKINDRVYTNLGLRVDHFDRFGWQCSPSVGLKYAISKEVSLKGSVGRAYRIPTFTDLYYRDAANIGLSSLLPESSWTYEAGMDCQSGAFKCSAVYFYRTSSDTIDWIRYSPSDPWRAANIGSARTNGFEASASLGDFFFSYTCLDIYAKHDYMSKYVLDYLQHHISTGLTADILGFKNSWVLNWEKREGSTGYIVADVKISKEIIKKEKLKMDAFFEITNLFNIAYSEQSGIPMPGRWIRSGARVEF